MLEAKSGMGTRLDLELSVVKKPIVYDMYLTSCHLSPLPSLPLTLFFSSSPFSTSIPFLFPPPPPPPPHTHTPSAKIFQMMKCSLCKRSLTLPAVHFLCEHSFHQGCLDDEFEHECSICARDNRSVVLCLPTRPSPGHQLAMLAFPGLLGPLACCHIWR